MDDEEVLNAQVPPEREKKGKKKGIAKDVRPPKAITDLEAGHRKFMMVMVGLFVLILVLMVVFNQYFDFAVDGGI